MTYPTLASLLFDHDYKALVIGSGGSIGSAFVQAFEADPYCIQVDSISRSQHMGFDIENEQSIADEALRWQGSGPYNIIVDATGALTIDGVGPEKSLPALKS